MNAPVIGLVVSFVGDFVVKPPELTGLHTHPFVSRAQEAAPWTLQNQMIAIANSIVLPFVNVAINPAFRG